MKNTGLSKEKGKIPGNQSPHPYSLFFLKQTLANVREFLLLTL